MPFPTVAYTRDTPAGYPGMIATTEPHWITSQVVAAASADIPPGVAVMYGTLTGTVTAMTAAGKFAGITVVDRSLPAQNLNVFKALDQLSVMKNGTIWVTAVDAVVPGNPVYYVTASGLLQTSATGGTLIPMAEWATVAAAGAIAMLRLGVTK